MSGAAKKSAGGEELVTLSRAEYEALLARLEEATDKATVTAAEIGERAHGKARARRDHVSGELARRLILGESPVRIWREHRGLKASELAAKAAVPAGYLSEIETGKKPGSLDAMKRIADALEIPLDDLVLGEDKRGRR